MLKTKEAEIVSQLDFIESQNIIAWIFNREINNERGRPIEFHNFSFMIDPYNDWTPEQGVRKSSQCGWSVMTNLKLFYAAQHGIPGYGIPAANVIYTLPSDTDVNAFVPSKTNLLIKHNESIGTYLRDEHGKIDVDSIERKKIGDSMVYFKGTRSKTAAIMLTADLLIHDEADRSEQNIVEEYESRIAQSMYRGRWIFSNPSAPNMPADLMYQASDQKHWFIKCEHCGAWQYLDWYKLSEYEIHYKADDPHTFIDDKKGQYVCGKCAAPISDDNRRRGRWIRKYRDRKASGYWVSHMMYPWISAKQLIEVEKKKSKSYFMNFVRGLPYIGSDVVVDSQTIVNNIVLDKVEWKRGEVAMGVDNGDVKHYVIGNADGIFEVGTTRSWEDIELLIQKYEATTVIDLNPYPNKPRELAAKYRPMGKKRWRVYCSFYIEQSKNYELVDWGERDKRHMVYPVRELLFDDLVAYISNGNMKFLRSKQYFEEYISHWETMYRGDFVGVRRAEDVGHGSPHQAARGVWLSSTGKDHFCHATLYYYVARAKIVAGGGKVLSTAGSMKQVIKDMSGGRVAPEPGSVPGTIKQTRSVMPNADNLKRFMKQKKQKKGGAISGNM